MTLYKEISWLLKLSCYSDCQAVRMATVTHSDIVKDSCCSRRLQQTQPMDFTAVQPCPLHVVPISLTEEHLYTSPPYKNSTDLHESEKWPWKVQGGSGPPGPPWPATGLFASPAFRGLTWRSSKHSVWFNIHIDCYVKRHATCTCRLLELYFWKTNLSLELQ